ncbi:MAG: Lrp/AsnC ligand binding domain-containing protein [Proteobacteria bacterium]|nr:Lrp/AsnC ligand binding domain-containing protein [Pseudomonadota bacterium]
MLKRDPFEQYAEAVLLISVLHRRQRAVTEHLKAFPEIKLCQTINGDYELMCRVKVPQLEDMAAVLETISEIPGVERMKSVVVLATNFDRSYTETASLASLQAAGIDRGEAG